MKVLKDGSPELLEVQPDIVEFTPALPAIAGDMMATMYANAGVGLAANQVGYLGRIIVADCTMSNSCPRVFVNPSVSKGRIERNRAEGCLSYPGMRRRVARFDIVDVVYFDLDGVLHKEKFTGLWAQCLQHEIDHLDGKDWKDSGALESRP